MVVVEARIVAGDDAVVVSSVFSSFAALPSALVGALVSFLASAFSVATLPDEALSDDCAVVFASEVSTISGTLVPRLAGA